MPKENVTLLNKLILSMVTKQELLDKLKSDVFNINIYRTYINALIKINLNLMNLEGKTQTYHNLIDSYLHGNIKDPDEILKLLKNNNDI